MLLVAANDNRPIRFVAWSWALAICALEAFERAGLQFIPKNGGGAGIRMREREAT